MNLVDATVTKILSKPYYRFGKWWVDVEFISYGSPGKTEIICNTEQEANGIKVGYVFTT